LLHNVICLVKKIRFFRLACKSLSKLHVSIGHTTVVASALFFGQKELQEQLRDGATQLTAPSSSATLSTNLSANYHHAFPALDFKFDDEFEFQDELVGSDGLVYGNEPVQWVLLRFQQPVFCPVGSLIIASRLDTEDGHRDKGTGDESASQCRLAFYGPVKMSLVDADVKRIKVYHAKEKRCEVFRLTDVREHRCYELIAWKLFGQHSNMTAYTGLILETENGEKGIIAGSFGTSGKFKVKFSAGVVASNLKTGPKPSTLILHHRKYIHESGSKEIRQFVNGLDSTDTAAPITPTASLPTTLVKAELEIDSLEPHVDTGTTVKSHKVESKLKVIRLPTAAEEAATAKKKAAAAVWREKNKAALDDQNQKKQDEEKKDVSSTHSGINPAHQTEAEKKAPAKYVPTMIVLPSFNGGGGKAMKSIRQKRESEKVVDIQSPREAQRKGIAAVATYVEETLDTATADVPEPPAQTKDTVNMDVRSGVIEKLSKSTDGICKYIAYFSIFLTNINNTRRSYCDSNSDRRF